MNKKLLNNVLHCIQDKAMIRKNADYFEYHNYEKITLNGVNIKKLFEKYNKTLKYYPGGDDDWGFMYGCSDKKTYGYSLKLALLGPFCYFTKSNWADKTLRFIHAENAIGSFEKELVEHIEAQGFIFLPRDIAFQRIDLSNSFYTASEIFLIYSALFRDMDNFPFSFTQEEELQYENNIINDDTHPFNPKVLEDFKKTENYKKWEQWLDEIEENGDMYQKNITISSHPTEEELEQKVCIDILMKRQKNDPKYFLISLEKKNMGTGTEICIMKKMLKNIINKKYASYIQKKDKFLFYDYESASLVCKYKFLNIIKWVDY
jgi:hypothetical protein